MILVELALQVLLGKKPDITLRVSPMSRRTIRNSEETRVKPASTRLFTITVLLLSILFSPIVRADVNLTFGVYTTDKPSEMVKAYRPILNRLETELAHSLGESVSIALKVSSSYEKGVRAIVEGNVDLYTLGAASYISAREQNPSLRLLALESTDGLKTFNGIISVATDSSINSIPDLSGKSFAFGNKNSTIGRFLSQALLSENGISADDLFAFDYLGRHDRVGYAVANKEFDAGALKEGSFNKLVSKGVKIRAIATFQNVNRAWVASSNMDKAMFELVQTTMLSLDDQSVFKPFDRRMFVSGADEDYDIIRKAIAENYRFFTTVNVEDDFAQSTNND